MKRQSAIIVRSVVAGLVLLGGYAITLRPTNVQAEIRNSIPLEQKTTTVQQPQVAYDIGINNLIIGHQYRGIGLQERYCHMDLDGAELIFSWNNQDGSWQQCVFDSTQLLNHNQAIHEWKIRMNDRSMNEPHANEMEKTPNPIRDRYMQFNSRSNENYCRLELFYDKPRPGRDNNASHLQRLYAKVSLSPVPIHIFYNQFCTMNLHITSPTRY